MKTFYLFIGMLICYGIPIVGFLLFRRKKKGVFRSFGFGMLTFIVSQLVIRIPILTFVLPGFAWFGVMQLNPWLYGIFLGLTAGLFEETARWAAIRFCLKSRWECTDGISFGLGHGGIEAMLLVGPNYIVYLVLSLTGGAALAPGEGLPLLMGAMERLFTMGFHIGASLIVMYGIRTGRAALFLWLALALHTISDAAVIILPARFGVGSMGMEAYILVISVLTLFLGLWLYRRDAGGKRLSDSPVVS